MKLSIKKEDLGRLGYSFEVSMPKSEYQKKFDNKLNYYVQNIQIKGFRKGKAPLGMVERTYGEGIREEVAQDLIPKMIEEAYKKEDIKPVTDPEVKEVKTDDGLFISFDVYVQPEIAELNYEGIKAELKVKKVSKKEVTEEIKQILERKVEYKPLTAEDKKVEKEDYIYLDFEGTLEDGTPIEGGKAENYLLQTGMGNFIEDLDKALVGMAAGGEKSVDVVFPEEYHAKNLAGAKATFKVKVNSIVEKKYPRLTDALAKEVSGLETADELKERVEKNLTERREEEAKNKLRVKVFEQLVKKNAKIELPGKMVDDEFENLKKNNSEEKEEKELKKQAEQSVRGYFLLQEISKEHEINITDKLQEEIARFSMYTGKKPEDTAKMLQENGMMDKMAYDIWEKEVLDKVIEKVNNNNDAPAGDEKTETE